MLLVGGALLAIVGCGGSARADYEQDLAQVGRGVDDSLARIPTDGSQPIDSTDIARIADDLREAADQLDDLEPPEDAAKAQARLQRGLRGVANVFDELSSELGEAQSDSAKAELFVRFANDEAAESAFDDLIGAQERFATAGYRVFGTAPAKPAATSTSTAKQAKPD
jgi:hypothetical protein